MLVLPRKTICPDKSGGFLRVCVIILEMSVGACDNDAEEGSWKIT